jgi:hypothetical protein
LRRATCFGAAGQEHLRTSHQLRQLSGASKHGLQRKLGISIEDKSIYETMAGYIALVHKDEGTSYGVSFPYLPGCISAGDTFEEAVAEVRIILAHQSTSS